jgi:ABC-type uncharacterized transport system substrate-binding protein
VTIEDRAADGHYDRLPASAAELVEHRAAVIAANYLPAALAAKAATQAIPIVFLSGSDHRNGSRIEHEPTDRQGHRHCAHIHLVRYKESGTVA